ncbi:MAG: glycosyl hydrolase, partial [Myxococcota bacterium]
MHRTQRTFFDLNLVAALVALLLALPQTSYADKNEAEKPDPAKYFAGLSLRKVGPAFPSGRVVDFAVHPGRPHRYFAATASAGVWLTEDNGNTWKPVFDGQASYATGVIKIDPNNPDIVWVGSGENNAQRSVGWGDGVYKSVDGGVHWKNVGLKDSGHIGDIAIHPENRDIVYVAAQGPLWSKGGDRGLYKTTDGGKNWKRVLEFDEHTGANEILLHPERPDEIVVSSWQRRRHLWVLIDGGPGSAIHKSSDGGKTWAKQTQGLPNVELGRIGLALAPSQPDTVYAIIEAEPLEGEAEKKGGAGVYRSK